MPPRRRQGRIPGRRRVRGVAWASTTPGDGGAGDAGDGDDAAPPKPAQWRVARLADDPTVTIVDGTLGKRPLLVALGAAGLSHGESHRVVSSLQDVRDVDHFDPKDTFSLARDKASGRVVAFELAGSPVGRVAGARGRRGRRNAPPRHAPPRAVVRARAHPQGACWWAPICARRSSTRASRRSTTCSRCSTTPSRATPSCPTSAPARACASSPRSSASTARSCAGPRSTPSSTSPRRSSAPPVRVYWFGDDDHRHGWYDAKGRQPTHGGWRMPIPLARVVSPFNPHRMHPVLHVVMPHNGVDLRASTGTPVYATAAGTVVSRGQRRPVRQQGRDRAPRRHLERLLPPVALRRRPARGPARRGAAAHRVRRADRARDGAAPALRHQEGRRSSSTR